MTAPEQMTSESMEALAEISLIKSLHEARDNVKLWEIQRKLYEKEIYKRLEKKEEAGERAKIEMCDGRMVHLADTALFFSYEDQDFDRTIEWLNDNGLAGIVKPPKPHYQTLNKVMRERNDSGQDVPDWFKVEGKRQLLTRGMS